MRYPHPRQRRHLAIVPDNPPPVVDPIPTGETGMGPAGAGAFLAYAADLLHILECPACDRATPDLPPPPAGARAFIRAHSADSRFQMLLRRLGGACGPALALQPQHDTLDYLDAERATCRRQTRDKLTVLRTTGGIVPQNDAADAPATN